MGLVLSGDDAHSVRLVVAWQRREPPTSLHSIALKLLDDICPIKMQRDIAECSICLQKIGKNIDEIIVSKLPRLRLFPDIQCIIDRFLFGTTDSSIRSLPCGHSFHSSCIERWLLPKIDTDSFCCPCCRTIVH